MYIKKTIHLLIIGVLFLTSINANASINAEIFKTPNNIEIILLRDPTTDLVSVNMGFKGAGAIADENNKAGLGQTMMNLIFRSDASGMDRHEKARKIDELGILSGINYDVNDDDIELSFKCPIENLKSSFKMLHTILFKAELNNTELNKIKNFGIQNNNLANAKELDFASKTLRTNVFKGHPYANTASGNQQSLQSLNLEDIKFAFAKRLAKDNLIVAVVGNLDKETIANEIDSTFANLAVQSDLPTISNATQYFDGKVKTIYKDTPQSTAIFAQESISFNNKDFYPLLILNRILGGEPFTSRLWIEIREKKGLVYNISTNSHGSTRDAHIMTGWFKCNNQDVSSVINIIRDEWRKLKDNGVSRQEFEDAKTGIIGKYALNFVSPELTSYYLLNNRLLGFDIKHINERNDKIKQITLNDVNRVAKEYLHPEQLSFIAIGNP